MNALPAKALGVLIVAIAGVQLLLRSGAGAPEQPVTGDVPMRVRLEPPRTAREMREDERCRRLVRVEWNRMRERLDGPVSRFDNHLSLPVDETPLVSDPHRRQTV